MIVSVAIECFDGLRSIYPVPEVNVRKALTQSRGFILGQVQFADRAEWFHQVLQVRILCALRQIGHTDGQGIISVALQNHRILYSGLRAY